MDRRERYLNEPETFQLAFMANQTRLWTMLPGFVVKFPGTNGAHQTVDVQPTIQGRVVDDQGNVTWENMPVLMDCPILFQGGGKVTATFPITAGTQTTGDECVVFMASRCIDAWWQLGGIQVQPELRMHNLSDGFALIGVRSLPRSLAVDTANACLISDDGLTYVKLNQASQLVAVQAKGGINLNGVTIDQNGNVVAPGTVKGSDLITSSLTSLNSHVHTGVTTGGSSTGGPTG